MYDHKTVRRRRAVLALLVASSLILLTAYFGESAGGGLHAIQRGVGDVISPVQEGANRALKPVRDLVGWAGDTFDAKGENEALRRERDKLREQAAAGENAVRENRKLKGLLELDQNLGLSDYEPVTTRVIAQSPTVWFATIKINKGTSDGIRRDMPVVATDGEGAGLIGKVTDVSGGNAIVTLITDSSMHVAARTASRDTNGIVEADVGDPNDLILRYTQRNDDVRRGDRIVTRGTVDPERPSLFPPGIPIGRVTHVEEPGTDAQEVHLRPDVNVRSGLEFVQVLTKPSEGAA